SRSQAHRPATLRTRCLRERQRPPPARRRPTCSAFAWTLTFSHVSPSGSPRTAYPPPPSKLVRRYETEIRVAQRIWVAHDADDPAVRGFPQKPPCRHLPNHTSPSNTHGQWDRLARKPYNDT